MLAVGQHCDKPDDMLQMGYISGVFGVQGWVKVFSYTDPRSNIVSYEAWYLVKNKQCYRVDLKNGRKQGKGLIVAQLAGCTDRDVAQQLIDAEIWIPKSQLPALDENEYYWSDLIGLEVFAGEVGLGKVTGLLETGANDVLVIKGERERLVPFLQPDVVKSIDLTTGKIIVDWDPEF